MKINAILKTYPSDGEINKNVVFDMLLSKAIYQANNEYDLIRHTQCEETGYNIYELSVVVLPEQSIKTIIKSMEHLTSVALNKYCCRSQIIDEEIIIQKLKNMLFKEATDGSGD